MPFQNRHDVKHIALQYKRFMKLKVVEAIEELNNDEELDRAYLNIRKGEFEKYIKELMSELKIEENSISFEDIHYLGSVNTYDHGRFFKELQHIYHHFQPKIYLIDETGKNNLFYNEIFITKDYTPDAIYEHDLNYDGKVDEHV